jgi:hypothetical protein
MPTATRSVTDDVQGQVLETIRKSQEAVVDALRSWSEAAEQFVPKTGNWPGAERLPTPAELVDTAYDFTGELLNTQREFFHKALQVTAPLRDRIEEQGTRVASATAKS